MNIYEQFQFARNVKLEIRNICFQTADITEI